MNFNHALEAVIEYADKRIGGIINPPSPSLRSQSSSSSSGGGCSFIAQLGPCTINTGFLMYKVSEEGDRLLSDWVTLHKFYASQVSKKR
jgi:hypothetical protein